MLGQSVDDGSPPRARGFASTTRVPVPERTGRGPVSPRWNIRCWQGFCRWCSPSLLLHPPHLKAGAPPTFSVVTEVKAGGTGGAGLSVGADLSVNLPKAEADAGGRYCGHTPVPKAQSTERLMPLGPPLVGGSVLWALSYTSSELWLTWSSPPPREVGSVFIASGRWGN